MPLTRFNQITVQRGKPSSAVTIQWRCMAILPYGCGDSGGTGGNGFKSGSAPARY